MPVICMHVGVSDVVLSGTVIIYFTEKEAERFKEDRCTLFRTSHKAAGLQSLSHHNKLLFTSAYMPVFGIMVPKGFDVIT